MFELEELHYSSGKKEIFAPANYSLYTLRRNPIYLVNGVYISFEANFDGQQKYVVFVYLFLLNFRS